ncbi:MAG: sulfatase-like hydrolase/transferase [Bryobacteraceae bacterium]|nr:sulfatase-like hydrolase/transferase [Bryobacteraceae bacterium]
MSLKHWCIVALGAAVACQPSCAKREPAEKPNIVLILADDLGMEAIGAYGGESYRTPNLDRLAAEGIRFDRAYAQPLCTPTRLQLMTGKYNCRNWKAFGIMDPAERTFGHMMSEAGYTTCISGKWQLYSYNPPDFEPEWRGKGKHPKDAGFDEYHLWHALHTEDKGSRYADPAILANGTLRTDAKGKYGPDLYADYIMDFIERNANRPFFVYYPMALTHAPFNPTPRSQTWAKGNRLENDPKYFGDMVEYMDEIVGRLVAKLDELKLREKTLVLFFSDNGSDRLTRSRMKGREVRGGKGECDEAGTRMPLIANWPGVVSRGQVLDDLIDSTDFYPTLAELAGFDLSKEGQVDGRSFADRLRGQPGNPREWVFFHHDPRPGVDKKGRRLDRWAQERDYKLFDDGRFLSVSPDYLEETLVAPDSMTPAMTATRARLQKVLDSYPNPGPMVKPGTPGY